MDVPRSGPGAPRGGGRREVRLSRPLALLLAALLLLSLLISGILLARGDQRAAIVELERQLGDARAEALTARILMEELEQTRRAQADLLSMLGIPRRDQLGRSVVDSVAVPPETAPAVVPPPDAAVPAAVPPPAKWPAKGAIIREFTAGDPAKGIEDHPGLDIAGAAGAPVVAAADGDVDFVGEDEILGKYLEIRHGLDYVTVYGHCSWVGVGPGHRVRRGEQIAKIGKTGRASVYQLHFEVWHVGVAVDPRKVLTGEPAPR